MTIELGKRLARQPGEDGSASAVTRHFGGDAALHDAFVSACRLQFEADAVRGDLFIAQADLKALHRLAHDLESAFRLCGDDSLVDLAAQIKRPAFAGELDMAHAAWANLRSRWPHP